ncbi:MAG: YbcC family protein [Niveispirillum sp.]|uniref:YbcC family protein n=1 Tax=Niveispirillum sp. TaxID=1917217 RepID=UPI003BA6CC16
MFKNLPDIAPPATKAMFAAANDALRAVPPAFPLEATVAVNPFLGQTGEDLAHAAARLARVGGVRLTRERFDYAAMVTRGEITDADLVTALQASPYAGKPADLSVLKSSMHLDMPTPEALPTIADLAARATGTDWPAIIARCIGLWAAGYFDRGQALWTPAPGAGTFAAWREWATHDLTPELAGLTGFCRHVATCPDTPDRALLRAAQALGLEGQGADTLFHRLLIDLGGWAQHARWLLWQAELSGGADATLADLLVIRLVWEEALLAHLPELADEWAGIRAAHARPVVPDAGIVLDCILQHAAELAHQRTLSGLLTASDTAAPVQRPRLQAAFCIDVRSEPFRRALESLDPGIATLGFAGFFGLPVAHRATASDLVEARLPVLLSPRLHSHSCTAPAQDTTQRIAARAVRAFGRFRQAAVSSFAFVEAAGPFYGAKLVRDALGLGHHSGADAPPVLTPGLSAADKVATAAAVLKAMSLTSGHARLVLLLGHGANVTNNPHESAYHCGACGGHKGDVSARLLAALLNDAEARAGLPAHGIDLPADTLFLAGLHDTVTDHVTLYNDTPRRSHEQDIAEARTFLDRAAHQVRVERADRLPGASAASLLARARNWAEVRPEWGLAGCAAFIAAPRAVTASSDLKGRAFLHSYDWQDDAGFGTLELILTAPVVVASWISLQYYGSAVAPALFGGGDKLIHNVTAGIGVVEGNGGRLRAGLPWQAVHDGEKLAHPPLRLSVMVEAPQQAIADILDRHPSVKALFDNGWLSLFALDGGRVAARWRPGQGWEQGARSQAA